MHEGQNERGSPSPDVTMAPIRTTFALRTHRTLPAAEGLRSPRSGLRIVGVVLLFPMMAVCKDHGKPGWQFEGHVSRSRFWEYHDRSDEPPCPTLLDLLDEHAQTVGGKIGLTVEESRPLHYYRFKDQADLASGCSGGVPACASGDAVLAQKPFDAHEQVHTYVFRAWAKQSVGLLEEGEAVALSCNPSYPMYVGRSPRDALGAGDWRQFLYLDGNSSLGYAAAGYWVTYLAQRYGWHKVGELHRRVLPGLSADDFAIEFARVFPTSMEQAWAEALSGNCPPCDYGWSCLATVMSPGDVVQPACDGELHRSIEISAQAGVVLTHRAPILLQNCAATASPVYELLPGKAASTTSWASLPPGTYRILGEYTPPSDVTFVAYMPSPFVAADCEQAGRVPLKPDQATFVDLLPGTIDGCLRLDGAGQAYQMYLLFMDLPATGSAVVCESSDPTASCTPIPARGSTTLTVGAGAALHLQNAQSVPPTSRSWGEIIFYPATPVDGGS
jgi:hypothetical protein